MNLATRLLVLPFRVVAGFVLAPMLSRLGLLLSRLLGRADASGKPPFVLLVRRAGSYSSDSFLALACEVTAHRLWHFANGDGLID